MSYECVIGLLRLSSDSQTVSVSELKEHIAERSRQNRQLRDLGVMSHWLYYKEWTLRDYADWQKQTNLTRFNYCPECGQKIDWGAIRKEEPT